MTPTLQNFVVNCDNPLAARLKEVFLKTVGHKFGDTTLTLNQEERNMLSGYGFFLKRHYDTRHWYIQW